MILLAFLSVLPGALAGLAIAWLSAQRGRRTDVETNLLRPLLDQILAAQRAEAENRQAQIAGIDARLAARLEESRLAWHMALNENRMAQASGLGDLATRLTQDFGDLRLLLEVKLREMMALHTDKLAAIQASVNEQLHQAVEKQMETSFQRVIEQFAAVQKAMGDVQAVTAQIGDLRRIFSNVKSRGGWGETQLRVMLDDILPPGGYEMNRKLRAGSDTMVEFALPMPVRGDQRPWLAIDAKFPVEDYSRLLDAAESGDQDAERAARRGLEQRLRAESKTIAAKYIAPPETVEFAVLYLSTDGLYAEAARCPGLIEEISRVHKVLILGPSLLPALLRTVQLGFVTLALEQKADEIRQLLGATRGEMIRMDEVLDKLGKQAGRFSATIEDARTRTRAVHRTLRRVEAMDPAQAAALLELDPGLDLPLEMDPP